jgi:C_GCAxxG_C_C family probable redox protein
MKCGRRSFVMESLSAFMGIGITSSLPFASSIYPQAADQSRNEIFRKLDDLVDQYFPMFGTCSQTSFYALNQAFSLKAKEFVKALASMPGIALRGETCGAVTGSLLAIALALEEDPFDEKRRRLSREPSIRFCEAFEKEYGSTRCRDVIARVSGKAYRVEKPEDYELLGQDVYRHCPAVIKKAVHKAAELMLKPRTS